MRGNTSRLPRKMQHADRQTDRQIPRMSDEAVHAPEETQKCDSGQTNRPINRQTAKGRGTGRSTETMDYGQIQEINATYRPVVTYSVKETVKQEDRGTDY